LHDGAVNVVSEGHWSGLFPLVALADLQGVRGPVADGGSLLGDSDGDVDAEHAARTAASRSVASWNNAVERHGRSGAVLAEALGQAIGA
jgi:hypothetical protein